MVKSRVMSLDPSLLPAAMSTIGILGIRRKAVWGPVVQVKASLAWMIYGSVTNQWGIAIEAVVALALYTATMVKWMNDAR